MRHNTYKFTIKFVVSKKIEEKALEKYLQLCCDAMPQKCMDLGETLVSNIKSDTYVAFLAIKMHDYGVPQVGICLVASWIEQLYKLCEDFMIDAVIVHPKTNPPARGAIIKWDYTNDCPVVHIIS